MLYQLEKLPGEPIVVCILTASFDAVRDRPILEQQLTELLDRVTEPVFYAIDTRALSMRLDDRAKSGLVKGEVIRFRHPKIRQIVAVSDKTLHRRATRPLESVTIFDTLGEALDYARRQTGAA